MTTPPDVPAPGPPGSADVHLPTPLSELEVSAPPLPPDDSPEPTPDTPMIALQEAPLA